MGRAAAKLRRAAPTHYSLIRSEEDRDDVPMERKEERKNHATPGRSSGAALQRIGTHSARLPTDRGCGLRQAESSQAPESWSPKASCRQACVRGEMMDGSPGHSIPPTGRSIPGPLLRVPRPLWCACSIVVLCTGTARPCSCSLTAKNCQP